MIVKDRLPAGLNLAEVPSGNGWTCSGAVGDARFECRSSEVVNAGATSTSDITVKVNVTAEAAQAGERAEAAAKAAAAEAVLAAREKSLGALRESEASLQDELEALRRTAESRREQAIEAVIAALV